MLKESAQASKVEIEAPDGTEIYIPQSPSLRVSEDWTVSIRNHVARSDEDPWVKFNLGGAWLPANTLVNGSSPLRERPKVCRAICMAIDALLLRVQPSKSTHLRSIAVMRTHVKFFEYCWLNDIFELRQFPEALWQDFEEKFVRGGWAMALQIEERFEKLASSLSKNEFAALFDVKVRRRGHDPTASVSIELLKLLGTNYSGARGRDTLREVVAKRAPIYSAAMDETKARRKRKAFENGASASVLSQTLTDIQYLAELSPDLGLSSLPTQMPYLYAKKHGKRVGRTETLTPSVYGAKLLEAYRWIEVLGDDVVELATALQECMRNIDRPDPSRSQYIKRVDKIKNLPVAKRIGEAIGLQIVSMQMVLRGNRTSAMAVIKTAYTACFEMIGLMNGRRHAEISSKEVGLFRGCLSCVNEELDLWSSFFYVEKSERDYVEFFVNELTRKAIQLVERLSDIAWSHPKIDRGQIGEREQKLFAMQVATERAETIQWYDHRSGVYEGDSGLFLYLAERRLGSKIDGLQSHQNRRAYAIVYIYRYEDPLLLALSRQLRHRDLGMTTLYFVEPAGRSWDLRAERLWAIPQAAKAVQAHAEALRQEVDEVSKEKLADTVAAIVEGSVRFSGGFVKLIARFVRIFGSNVSYSREQLSTLGADISRTLIHKGHRSLPFQHGDCNAGPPSPLARCYNREEKRLGREKASAKTCGDCPFHTSTLNHLRSLQEEAEIIREALQDAPDSVKSANERRELQALEQAIVMHLRRLT